MTDEQLAQIVDNLVAIRILLCLILGALFAGCFWRKY